MDLLNLFAVLTLNNKSYKDGLKDSEKGADEFAKKSKKSFAIAAVAITAVVAVVTKLSKEIIKLSNATIQYGADIDDNAQKLQLSTEAYQKWAKTLQLAGTDISSMSMGMRQMTEFTQQLSEGNKDAILSIQRLGISYSQFMGMSVDEQLYAVVDALQGVESQTEKVQLAQAVFGNRTYQELLPLLNQEQGSIKATWEELDKLGVIMSDDMVADSAKLGDSIDFIKMAITGLKNNIVADFYPALKTLFSGVSDLLAGKKGAAEQIGQSVIKIFDSFISKLPSIVDKISDFLPQLIDIVINIIVSLVDALGNIDWQSMMDNVLKAILKAVLNVPKILAAVFNAIRNILKNLIDSAKNGELFGKIRNIGLAIGQAIINGLAAAVESGINLVVDILNGMTGLISKLWTWAGIPEIPKIPTIELPRLEVEYFAKGGMIDDLLNNGVGSIIVSGEDGAEIAHTGSRGSGIANVEQIAEAQALGIEKSNIFDTIDSAVEGIVNGLAQVLLNNENNTALQVNVQLGDKQLNDIVYNAVETTLQKKGYKPLKTVARY